MEIKPITVEQILLKSQTLFSLQKSLSSSTTQVLVDARIAVGPEMAIVMDVRPAFPLQTIRF
jgi:hypothetical protein